MTRKLDEADLSAIETVFGIHIPLEPEGQGPPEAVGPVEVELPDHFEGTALGQAQQKFLESLGGGTSCPCCGRFAKLNWRGINNTMAAGLCWLVGTYKGNGRNWIDVPNHGPAWMKRTNQHPSLRWWGLVEKAPNDDPTKKSSGLWRPTKLGIRFALGKVDVPREVLIFDKRVVTVSKQRTMIEQAQGVVYDYWETMQPAFRPPKTPRKRVTKRANAKKK